MALEASASRSAAAPRSADNLLLADYNQTALQTMVGQLRGEGYEVTAQPADVSDHASVAALADAAADLGPVTRIITPPASRPSRPAPSGSCMSICSAPPMSSRSSAGSSPLVAPASSSAAWPVTWARAIPREVELALAYTPTAELLGLDFLAPEAVGNSGAAYTLAKRANALRVRAAAVTWGERGARVNCISPGIIATPLARDEMSGPNAAGYRHMIDTSAAGRLGTPSDVAAAAALLLGPDGSFITGSDLLIDGGVIAAMRAAEHAPAGSA